MIALAIWALLFVASLQASVILDWTWEQGVGAPATSFSIQRAAVAAGPFATLSTVAAPALTYTDQSALTPGSTYYYRVIPVGASSGPPSNVVSILVSTGPPPPPPPPPTTSCSVTVAPAAQPAVALSAVYSLIITAPSGCTWAATSNATWITITAGASGTGNGTVNYTVGASTATAPRIGDVTISQTVKVTQAGVAPPPPTTLTVSVVSVSTGRAYAVGAAALGSTIYIDRAYTISGIDPLIANGVLVKTSNEDDYITAANHLQLNLSIPATVYVLFDTRALRPASWLSGWTATGKKSSTTANEFNIYSKSFPAGTVTLGGNERATTGGGAMSMYVVVVKP